MEKQTIYHTLTACAGKENVFCDEPMKKHISFEVGGPADFLVTPQDRDAFVKTVAFCREAAIPFYVMGNGSNLLVRDGGFRGVMIKTRAMDAITVDGETLTAEPGALLKDVAQKALEAELTGMEFASGIPGSIGGAVRMNAGAYDGEMKEIVTAIEVLTDTGAIVELSRDDCHFGYRHSVFQEKDWYALSVKITLKKGFAPHIKEKMDELNERRRSKQPLEYPSAGSTFRRPEGYFAGKLVQDCGFKGYRVGGAQVSEKHSGFVINRDGATASDIITLIETIQHKVKEDFDVDLKTEVIMIGEPCD